MYQNRTFSEVINRSGLGFCLVSSDSTVLEHNETFNEMVKAKDIIGKRLIDYVVHKDDLKELLHAVTDNKAISLPVDFYDGNDFFYTKANAFSCDEKVPDGAAIGIFFTEVNQFKDLESELEKRIAAEVEKNRQKDAMMNQQAKLATMGEMIGNIAHQWRQPLNILALVFQDIYIKYQLGSLDTDQMEKHYDKVNNLIQYMSQTIDDFRTFFKNEESDAPFDVNSAVNAVFDLVGTRFSTNNTQCRIEVIHNGIVTGTENGFKQVIINLLNNAQEAILSSGQEEGIIDISIESDGSYVTVMISDNGGGVPTDIINQIFEPYFTTKHQTQGTGLGLFMSKKIIEHHMNGKLEVFNETRGAVFKITLPATPGAAAK